MKRPGSKEIFWGTKLHGCYYSWLLLLRYQVYFHTHSTQFLIHSSIHSHSYHWFMLWLIDSLTDWFIFTLLGFTSYLARTQVFFLQLRISIIMIIPQPWQFLLPRILIWIIHLTLLQLQWQLHLVALQKQYSGGTDLMTQNHNARCNAST